MSGASPSVLWRGKTNGITTNVALESRSNRSSRVTAVLHSEAVSEANGVLSGLGLGFGFGLGFGLGLALALVLALKE